jgi:hypothetical protein
MKNFRSFSRTCILLAIVVFALPGCKLNIKVPLGGQVVSSDGAYICEAGQSCVIDIVDIFFDQTFIAEPAPGFYFGGWTTRDGYLCGGETASCRLSTAKFEGDPELQSMLESDETFSLKPRFMLILNCPKPGLVLSPAPSGP